MGIRRPPISRLQIELFGIDPVEFAVAQRLRAAPGKLPDGVLFRFSAACADYPEIVIAEKADPAPVGRDFRIVYGVVGIGESSGLRQQMPRGLRFQIEPGQLLLPDKKESAAVRSPFILRWRKPSEARLLSTGSRS